MLKTNSFLSLSRSSHRMKYQIPMQAIAARPATNSLT